MTRHRRLRAAGLAAASALLLVGCATAPAGSADSPAPLGSVWPAPPTSEVIVQGTVFEIEGTLDLCLGAIMESYPPQCGGAKIPITGWDWNAIEGWETASDVTWGAYAVQGTYDGETMEVTQPPIMLALYDPMMDADPTGDEPGNGDEAELAALQEELPERLGDAYLSSYPENGWLWVDVVWDDGTWQDAADAEFGDDVVIIRSAMRTLEQ
jgi:hypothetical protein